MKRLAVFLCRRAALLGFAGFMAILLGSGCGWLRGETKDEELKELDAGLSAENRSTPFDDALRELGFMIEAYDHPRTPIQSKNIGNETADKGALPSDIYTMISTAVNKVGRSVIFVPYDAKYVINESTTGGKIERLFPEVVISGGLTGFDKEMIEKERKGDVQGAWAGASASANYNAGEGASRITLDLNMLDYTTQSFFPGVLASNAIVVRKDHFGWGVSAYYMGCGGSFDSSVKTKQGVHAAIRMLVEFSTLELLGKYFEVPYWRCMKGANEDPNMCQQIQDRFRDLPDPTQAALIKRMLFLHGYKGLDRFKPGLDAGEQSVVTRVMQERSAKNMPELYVALWKTVPLKEARDRVIKDRKARQAEAGRIAEEKRAAAEEQAKANAEAEAKAAQEKQVRMAQYMQHVADADAALAKRDLKKARESYLAASALFSGEPYPQEKLAEIDKQLAADKAREDGFAQAVAEGEKLFAAKNYEAAKIAFEKAAKLKPDAAVPKARLEEIGKLLQKKAPTGIGRIGKDDWKD